MLINEEQLKETLDQTYKEAYFEGCLFGYGMAKNFIIESEKEYHGSTMNAEEVLIRVKEILSFQIQGIKKNILHLD